MEVGREHAPGWVKPFPSRARNIDFRPGVGGPSRGAQSAFGVVTDVTADESSGQTKTARRLHEKQGEVFHREFAPRPPRGGDIENRSEQTC